MNVGEYLVSKSPLNSGTALAHLLAMQTGGGTGKTIFAAQMTVCMEAPELTAVRRPAATANATPTQRAALRRDAHVQKGCVDILKVDNRIDVLTRTEVIFITSRKHQDSFVRTLENAVSVRKSRLVGVV